MEPVPITLKGVWKNGTGTRTRKIRKTDEGSW
jgi:hypothetical protein